MNMFSLFPSQIILMRFLLSAIYTTIYSIFDTIIRKRKKKMKITYSTNLQCIITVPFSIATEKIVLYAVCAVRVCVCVWSARLS